MDASDAKTSEVSKSNASLALTNPRNSATGSSMTFADADRAPAPGYCIPPHMEHNSQISSTPSAHFELSMSSSTAAKRDERSQERYTNARYNKKFSAYKKAPEPSDSCMGMVPMVSRQGRDQPMCISYHVRGYCFKKCRRRYDHRPHNAAADQDLLNWCAQAFKPASTKRKAVDDDTGSASDEDNDERAGACPRARMPLICQVVPSTKVTPTGRGEILKRLMEAGIRPPSLKKAGMSRPKPVCLAFVVKDSQCWNPRCPFHHVELTGRKDWTVQDLEPLRKFLLLEEVAKYWTATDFLTEFFSEPGYKRRRLT